MKEIGIIKSCNSKIEADLLLLKDNYYNVDKLMNSQDIIFKQLLYPMLDDVLKFLGVINLGARGHTIDADLKSKRGGRIWS